MIRTYNVILSRQNLDSPWTAKIIQNGGDIFAKSFKGRTGGIDEALAEALNMLESDLEETIFSVQQLVEYGVQIRDYKVCTRSGRNR
jgi:hypothetical protein